MEDEKEDNKQLKIVTSIGDSWIICRSQTHSGRVYYFNTLTGKAVWNLSDAEMKKAQLHIMSIQGQAGADIENCPEPTEPPVDTPQHGNPQQPPIGQRIYNKQIINNQFTKPYTVSPFANPTYHYNSVNNISDVGMNVVPAPVYNPNMWAVPPTHQVFLTPVVNPFTSPPMFNGLGLQQSPQNSLSNGFQVMNEFANNRLYQQGGLKKEQYRNMNSRMNQRFTRKFQNKSTLDLRNVLSAKRKVIDEGEDERWQETHDDNDQDITEDDLYPSDIDDEWLQAYTCDEKSKVNLNISSVWKLAGGRLNPDCWFIVVTAMVLLNHMKFLTSLMNSDERARVVTPLAGRRRLRRAAGAAAAPGPRARRANRLASRQMNKLPAGLDSLQDGSVVDWCMGLIQRNYFVIHLTDEGDLQKSESEIQKMNDSVPIFTVDGLKEYLKQNSPAPASRNITVTIFHDNEGSVARDKTPIPPKMTKDSNIENTDSINEPRTEEIKKKSDQPPVKRTVNAGVQTDFVLEPTMSSSSFNSISHVETIEIDHTLNMDIVLQSDSSKEEPHVAKKIKLNRKQSFKKDDPVKKPTFKWRKRRDAPNTSSNEDLKHAAASPSFSALLIQQNDNAVDYGKTMEITKESSPDEKESNASDVISNSVESDSMFKLNKKAIRSDPKYYEKDILMFEVTSDFMDDNLRKGCDEWLSRFVQIMEEVLCEILQQDPCFIDATMPPPWSIHEATQCIKRKFQHNTNVTYACCKLSDVLYSLSDRRGKIQSGFDSSSFMEMYSYGVNLIESLQAELQNSEDIQIAAESLSQLLADIHSPHMSHGALADTFNEDGFGARHDDAAKGIYENLGAVQILHDGCTAPATASPKKREPQKKSPQVSSNQSSPYKYNLRSIGQKKKTESARIKNTDNESTFFTGLGLKKNVSIDGPAIKISFKNSQTGIQASPNYLQEGNDTANQIQPRIIRKFNRCVEFEEKIKQNNVQFDYEEFTEDNNCSGKEFYLEDNYDRETFETEGKYSSPKSGDIDATTILKWFVDRTTCPIHRLLMQIHKFCTDTNEDLKQKEKLQDGYRTNLFEKTAKLNTHLDNLCKYLNSILHRSDIKSKFRDMMKELEIHDFVMDDTQAADYKVIIGKYLEQAGILLEATSLLTAEIKT